MSHMKDSAHTDPPGAKSMTDRSKPEVRIIRPPKSARTSRDARKVRADYDAGDDTGGFDHGVPF